MPYFPLANDVCELIKDMGDGIPEFHSEGLFPLAIFYPIHSVSQASPTSTPWKQMETNSILKGFTKENSMEDIF